MEELGHRIVRGVFHAEPFEFMFYDFTPGADMLFTIQFTEPRTDFVTRTRSLGIAQVRVEPIQARPAAFRGENLNLVASLQVITQVDETTLYFCTATAMADIGMNVIGEINGGCPGGQIHNIA